MTPVRRVTTPFMACTLFAFPAAVGLAASYDVVSPTVAAPLGFALMLTCGTLSMIRSRPTLELPSSVGPDPRADG